MRTARGVIAIVAATCLASCAGGAPGAQVRRTNIITGSTGSTWYTIGSALAEKANLSFAGHPITAVPGAGGVSNPVRVSMTGMDLGISYGPFLTAAYRGEPPFREPLPKLRMVASLVLNTLHVLAAPGLQLETVEDLIDLQQNIQVGSGPPGSGELFCLTALLDLKKIDLDAWQQQGHVLRLSGTGQRFDDWKDERLDAAFTFVNDPSPQLTELAVTRPARFLSMPASLRDQMVERWMFVRQTLPPGKYPHQDYPVETVALPSLLFAVDSVDESIVYALTKALYEHQDYLKKVHPGFEQWDPADLPDEVPIPLHTGAERYYRERGLLPAAVAAQRF